MPKLRTLRPPLKAPPSRLSRSDLSRDQVRSKEQPWRRWYWTKRWRDLRLEVLKRDGWKCRQTGALLTGKGNEPNAPVIDHIIPHRGDERLFWDIDNLQAVAKHWHDGEKQRQEVRDRASGR